VILSGFIQYLTTRSSQIIYA